MIFYCAELMLCIRIGSKAQSLLLRFILNENQAQRGWVSQELLLLLLNNY